MSTPLVRCETIPHDVTPPISPGAYIPTEVTPPTSPSYKPVLSPARYSPYNPYPDHTYQPSYPSYRPPSPTESPKPIFTVVRVISEPLKHDNEICPLTRDNWICPECMALLKEEDKPFVRDWAVQNFPYDTRRLVAFMIKHPECTNFPLTKWRDNLDVHARDMYESIQYSMKAYDAKMKEKARTDDIAAWTQELVADSKRRKGSTEVSEETMAWRQGMKDSDPNFYGTTDEEEDEKEEARRAKDRRRSKKARTAKIAKSVEPKTAAGGQVASLMERRKDWRGSKPPLAGLKIPEFTKWVEDPPVEPTYTPYTAFDPNSTSHTEFDPNSSP